VPKLDSLDRCKWREDLKASFEDVSAIAADIFQVEARRIALESSPDTIESWDSLQHLNLILALEQSFDLEFEPEEIERMTSIGAVLSILEEKQADQG
jgi:acyl carrier protein